MIGNFFNFDQKDNGDDDEKEGVTKEVEEISKKSDYVEDDPVEKMFNFFFGEKEENPMGLARFGSERFPGKLYCSYGKSMNMNSSNDEF